MFNGRSDDPLLRNAIKAIKPSSSHDDIWLTINSLIGPKKSEPIFETKLLRDKLLVQEKDEKLISKKHLTVVTQKKPTTNQFEDMLFAVKVSR